MNDSENPPEPGRGQIWFHTRIGSRYRIIDIGFNTITGTSEVIYQPLYLCEYWYFTRQLRNHPKAFLSLNDDGNPRFQFERFETD